MRFTKRHKMNEYKLILNLQFLRTWFYGMLLNYFDSSTTIIIKSTFITTSKIKILKL